MLDGIFMRLECLVVQCMDDLCVRVPSGQLSWRLASFSCLETLDVAFDNVGQFLDSCPVFCFAYWHLARVDLLQLCLSAGERHLACTCNAIDYGEESMTLCEVFSAGTPDYIRAGTYLCDMSYNPFCVCGACPTCSGDGSCGPDAQFSSKAYRPS